MERSRAIPEASSSREASAYDYAALPGYRSSLSSYDQQVSYDRQPINSDGHGAYYADHLSNVRSKEAPGPAYGDYSYTSSYDDISRRYGYGSDGCANLSEAYQGSSFGGKSAYYRDSSYRSASPRTSGFSLDGGGSTYGSRPHAYADEQWISNRYDGDLGSQKSILDSRSKPDAMSYELTSVGGRGNLDYKLSYSLKDYNVHSEQSASGYYGLNEGSMSGAMRDDKSSYLLTRKYETTPSGSYLPSAGASYDWKSAVDIQRAPAELGWKGFHSLSSIRHEQGIIDRAESSSRFVDDSAYQESRGYGKLSAWSEAAGRQAELDLEQKGYTEPVANGSKVADTKEASLPVQGVDLPKPANEGKKRQSRWGPVEENKKNGEDGSEKPKKKTRWSAEKSPVKEINLPNIMKELSADSTDIVALKARLIIINKILQSGQILDNFNGERSPSPEPIFDNFGFCINTREHRVRERLNKERQKIMARLAENQTPSKPVSAKPSKFSKKLYIPVDKYPDYNFIGLIIGPRGNTQKKMEKESGAKIFIRGKGSAKEGVVSTSALPGDDDNLHVHVEADSEDAVNKASEMVEKILVPIKDGQNELKRAQLRELASMNGTLRGNDVICLECKQPGHIAKDCANFLKGGSKSGDQTASKSGPKAGDKTASLVADSSNSDEIDNTHLYVACLPASIDDAQLLSLFSPFGRLLSAKVMTHPATGISKCYGFVKYADAADAAQAAALMNGYQMDGKVLAVKIKTKSEPAS